MKSVDDVGKSKLRCSVDQRLLIATIADVVLAGIQKLAGNNRLLQDVKE